MKTRYLILDEGKLVLSNYEDWKEIAKGNRNLPTEERRHFIFDDIVENGEHDRIIYEVDYETYKEWHKERERIARGRKYEERYEVLSLSTLYAEAELSVDRIAATLISTEKQVESKMMFSTICWDLRQWKEWAPMVLALYAEGRKREVIKLLREQFGLSKNEAYRGVKRFEERVQMYLTQNWR